ncbi:hypothetical protein [Rhizohabitans arisaemae]|uniref:hypothetical protein n=1 Tax=Rhizohabitans arisaemae TaxID=2720610 RepID=UPI0024B05DC3|nr:hypothetical protein [Rhizohabitans arisaemae]
MTAVLCTVIPGTMGYTAARLDAIEQARLEVVALQARAPHSWVNLSPCPAIPHRADEQHRSTKTRKLSHVHPRLRKDVRAKPRAVRRHPVHNRGRVGQIILLDLAKPVPQTLQLPRQVSLRRGR